MLNWLASLSLFGSVLISPILGRKGTSRFEMRDVSFNDINDDNIKMNNNNNNNYNNYNNYNYKHGLGSYTKYCSGTPAPNPPDNDNGYIEANPQLIKEVTNGRLYLAGNDDQQIYMAHVYGSPYEMGYAHGELLRDEVNTFISDVWAYMLSEFPYYQISQVEHVENMTLEAALQLTADLTAPFTPAYWYEELQGLSDASGVPYLSLLRITMLPELTRAACSMFGAWGKATPTGGLLQLRALDWDTDGPFKDYPALIVYHPSESGHVFANMGFTGWIGSITGISSSRLSISEIGVSCPDDTFGRESRAGYPFMYVLRDILQFDDSVQNATYRLENTRRTCYLILGVGDGNQNQFLGYQYSTSVMNAYTDTNMEPYNQTWHPRIDDIVYWGMDWMDPGYSGALSQQLELYYGNITYDVAIKNIVAHVESGDLHVALYDYVNDQVLISIHSKSDQNTAVQKAYQRPYIRFDLPDLFAENY